MHRSVIATVSPHSSFLDRHHSQPNKQLFNLERRPKTDPVFEALGNVDELNASIGVARLHCRQAGLGDLDIE